MSSKKAISINDFIKSHPSQKSFQLKMQKLISYHDPVTEEVKLFVTFYNKDFKEKVGSNNLLLKYVLKHKLEKNQVIYIYHIRRNIMKQNTKPYYYFDILCKKNKENIIQTSPIYDLHNVSDLFENHEVIHYYTTVKVNVFNRDFDRNKPEAEDNKKLIEVDKEVIFTENYNVYYLNDDRNTETIKYIFNKHQIKPKQETKLILCSCINECKYQKEAINGIIEKVISEDNIDINEFI